MYRNYFNIINTHVVIKILRKKSIKKHFIIIEKINKNVLNSTFKIVANLLLIYYFFETKKSRFRIIIKKFKNVFKFKLSNKLLSKYIIKYFINTINAKFINVNIYLLS